MDPIEAIVLGLVQGLTEFFPVSSSGHLAMLRLLFGGRDSGGLLFEVAVHVATLIAIVAFYRARIIQNPSRWDRWLDRLRRRFVYDPDVQPVRTR